MAEEFIDDIIKESSGDESISEDAIIQELEGKATEKPLEEKVDDLDSADKAKEITKEASSKVEEKQTPAEVEELAEKLGWNKDYQGPEKVDAATYILKSREIQDTMKNYNKDLKSQVSMLQESIRSLQEHNEKVYKVEVKKLESDLARLKKEKLAAVELADVEKVTELDDQIEALQKDLSKPKDNNSNHTKTNPVYDEWVKENQWYEEDDEMANYADIIAENYVGAPLERIYTLVRQRVMEVFPDRFESSSKETDSSKDATKPVGPTSPVEKGGTRESKAAFTVNDLTPEQRDIMRQFVRSGIMTEKQYVADIAKMQEG